MKYSVCVSHQSKLLPLFCALFPLHTADPIGWLADWLVINRLIDEHFILAVFLPPVFGKYYES